jgi:molybdate transport system ATP-binding protein
VALLDIGHLLHRRPSSLSGGEAQRIAIGRALLSDPAFLLMDEPCSSLDHARRQDIIAMILALHREARIPILYVSHDREEVNALADEIIELPPPSRPGCGA